MENKELKPENIVGDNNEPRKVTPKEKEPKENQQDSVAVYERALKEGIELGKKLKKDEKAQELPKEEPKKELKKRNVFFGMGDDI